jgi:hypothetical protein
VRDSREIVSNSGIRHIEFEPIFVHIFLSEVQQVIVPELPIVGECQLIIDVVRGSTYLDGVWFLL